MARAPFQILVIPFRLNAESNFEFAVFQRPSTDNYGPYWQWIAGGGEEDETPIQAAKRESEEEANINPNSEIVPLDSLAYLPAPVVAGFLWGPKVLVIPEYCFGINVKNQKIQISQEHQQYEWLPFDGAYKRVEFDTNKNSLWELNFRLTGKSLFPSN